MNKHDISRDWNSPINILYNKVAPNIIIIIYIYIAQYPANTACSTRV